MENVGLENAESRGVDTSGYNSMLQQQQSDNVSIYELEQDELIERIRHQLSGEVWDAQEARWIQINEPRANRKGIGHICSVIASHLDKNITLSHLSLKQIYQMAFEVSSVVTGIIFMKHTEYEIGPDDRDVIMTIIDHHVFANYMRALDGGERKHRETVIKSVESIVERQSMPQSGGGGLFGGLNLFKRNRPSGGGLE